MAFLEGYHHAFTTVPQQPDGMPAHMFVPTDLIRLPDGMRRLKRLEDENTSLKWIVTDLTVDRQMLRGVFQQMLREQSGNVNRLAGYAQIGQSRSAGRVGP